MEYCTSYILIYDKKGNFTGKFGYKGLKKGELFKPVDIIIDKENNVYVLDGGRECILKFSPKN